MTNERPMAGKVAYVTGGARGQGRAHCVRLAQAGADIATIDACGPVGNHIGYEPATPEDLADTVRLVEDEGVKISAERVDVRDHGGQKRVIASAIEQFGRLVVIVANCASKFGVVGPANSLELELGEFGIRVNSVHTYGVDTGLGNDLSMYEMFQKPPHYVNSF